MSKFSGSGANPAPKYDADYFIRKFSAIPARLWCTDYLMLADGRRCARGWCGVLPPTREQTPEDIALFRVLNGETVSINNGYLTGYPQKTPRARILAALRDAKKAGL